MKLAPLAVALGVFIVAAVSVRALNEVGFENAPFMVLAAGLLAGSAVAFLR